MSNGFTKEFTTGILVPGFLYALVGWWFANKLAAAPHLHIYKAHFVIGLAFEIAGVAALSHIVAKSERVQAFLVGVFFEQLCIFLLAGNVGIIFRAIWGSGGASEKALEEFARDLLFFVVTPFVVYVPMVVVNSRKITSWTNEARANTLGLILLLVGLLLQLFAAIHDIFQ